MQIFVGEVVAILALTRSNRSFMPGFTLKKEASDCMTFSTKVRALSRRGAVGPPPVLVCMYMSCRMGAAANHPGRQLEDTYTRPSDFQLPGDEIDNRPLIFFADPAVDSVEGNDVELVGQIGLRSEIGKARIEKNTLERPRLGRKLSRPRNLRGIKIGRIEAGVRVCGGKKVHPCPQPSSQ